MDDEVSMINQKSLDAKISKRNRKFSKEPWYHRREKMTMSIRHTSTREIVQVTIEGKGHLCKDLHDKILYGWFWTQLELQEEDLGEI
jgi:hypothetical protein